MNCESCIYYPPSSLDGKPCCFCDPTAPLLNCYKRKDDTQMTMRECERHEQIYKKLLEKFHPTITFDSKDCTPEELQCIKAALLRSVAIEELNIMELRRKDDEENG